MRRINTTGMLQIALILYIIFSFVPTASFWYTTHSIATTQATYHQGDKIYLLVDRDIYHSFFGSWTVTIRKYDTEGTFSYCTANSNGFQKYDANATIKIDKDENGIVKGTPLSWWASTNPSCWGPKLPKGNYYIETCHTINVPVVNDRKTCSKTNNFTIQ